MYDGLQNYVEQGVIAKRCMIGARLLYPNCHLRNLYYRHEYLGPSPHVAGFSLFGAEYIRIEWYDKFLNDRWVEKDTWMVDIGTARNSFQLPDVP